MKLDTENNEKAKYYAAFSYLNTKTIFKTKLLEYFDFDIKRAWQCDKNELSEFCKKEDLSIPRNFLSQKSKLDIDECCTKAFLDKDVKLLTIEDKKYPPLFLTRPTMNLKTWTACPISSKNWAAGKTKKSMPKNRLSAEPKAAT